MPNMGSIKEVVVPSKGILTRVMISVKTAAASATVARVIISSRNFANTVAGFTALKAAYRFHVYDSNIGGTLDIPINSTGKKIDRIFENGGVDYENQDDDNIGLTTGWTQNQSEQKQKKLYIYTEIDATEATLDMRVDIKAQEQA